MISVKLYIHSLERFSEEKALLMYVLVMFKCDM